MCKKIPLAVLGLMASLTLGCDKQETAPVETTTDTAETTLGQNSDSFSGAGKQMETRIEEAGEHVKQAVETTSEELAQTKDEVASKVEAAKGEVSDATEKAAAEAQPLIDQAMSYIKENKLDLAENALAKLEGMKASLPESVQSQISNVQKALETAKSMNSGGGIKLPGT